MSGVTPPEPGKVFDPDAERLTRLARRFYKDVEVVSHADGQGIALDGRDLKTPARRAVRLPGRGAAELVAAEWRAQGERIDPAAMPVTRLVWTGIDRIGPDPRAAQDEILGYAGSDLVCYRAEGPPALVARQAEGWDGMLDWLEAETGARLRVTSGIVHVTQEAAALDRIAAVLDAMMPVRLAALHTAVVLTGSATLALGLDRGRLDAPGAWALARIDEAFQQAQWGEDAEAAARDAVRYADLAAAEALMRALD